MKKKFRLAMPDTLVLITIMITIMCILTWLIPAGNFDTDGSKIVAGSFHVVESNPATLWDFFNSFGAGMSKGASTIFLSLIIGGAFGVLVDTGTIHAMLNTVVRVTKGNYIAILTCVAIVMSLFGALGVGLNVQLAFAPIMVLLCSQLGLDGILVGATCYMAADIGFSSSPINPLTVVLGQTIAEITPMSGLLERSISWVIFTGLLVWYMLHYANKIRKDPSKSLTGVYERAADESSAQQVQLKPAHVINLILLVAVFAFYCYGSFSKGWQLSQLMACMMILAIGAGVVGGMNPNEIAVSFTKGAKTMTYTALMVGFASGINVVMSDANIIHSVIYYLCIPLEGLSSAAAAVGMFLVNFVFNFFVSSGSGQCYIVMPIMAPMSDLLHVSRQIAVSAYQFGDGLCNLLLPQAGLLVGTLGIAKVPFSKWLKFIVPFVLIMIVTSSAFLVVMSMIGWT